MRLAEAEVCRCPGPQCRCEITAPRGAVGGHSGDRSPACCGHMMKKVR
jgi:hypothetical protein